MADFRIIKKIGDDWDKKPPAEESVGGWNVINAVTH
jgi:hypothetical protein